MKLFLLKEVNQRDPHGCKYYREVFSWYSMQLKESESVSHSVMSYSLRPQPSSSVHGILQARIQKCVTISFSRAFLTQGSNPGLLHCRQILYPLYPLTQVWKKLSEWVKVTQSCPTLYSPMDYTVHGILQARILEWVSFPFSRGFSNLGIKPRSPALQTDSLSAESQGKPRQFYLFPT